MTVNQEGLVDILEKLSKKLQLGDKKITIDEIIKKIINKNLCWSSEAKGIDLLTPDLLSAFFIKNIKMIIDEDKLRELNYKFDPACISKVIKCNSCFYELTDLNRNKVKVHKNDLMINLKKPIPLEVLLHLV